MPITAEYIKAQKEYRRKSAELIKKVNRKKSLVLTDNDGRRFVVSIADVKSSKRYMVLYTSAVSAPGSSFAKVGGRLVDKRTAESMIGLALEDGYGNETMEDREPDFTKRPPQESAVTGSDSAE